MQITTDHGITTGLSADGRIKFSDGHDGPRIDGRYAWRRYYTDAAGVVTDEVVPADLWESACELMRAVTEAHRAFCDSQRRSAEQALQRRADAIPDSDAFWAAIRGDQ